MKRFVLIAAVLLCLGRLASAREYVWVEAEKPDSINFEDYWTGADRPHLLSADKWLAAHFQKQDIQQNMPEGGYRLTYQLDVPESGTYNAWARVGMEWIRAPFHWRIDDGPWRPGPAGRTTTNVMQLKAYNEVAWLDLGTVDLQEGERTLTVRYSETQPDRDDMHIALDCFAFVRGHWVPEGELKPGQSYDSEIDRKAAEQVYRLPAPKPAEGRVSAALTGLWRVARYDDPNMDVNTYVPVQELPSPDQYPLRWRGIQVPRSQWNVDGLRLAHRTIYRTRFEVPEGHDGRGFKLHFSGTNWIVSVFVNGEFAGSHRGVWIPWDLDVSDHVRPGQVNTLSVAVKGCYYARDVENSDRADDLDRTRNRPKGNQGWVYYVAPLTPSTKGDGNGLDYGIVNPVTLTSVGKAYTEDVFVQPGPDRRGDKRLKVDATVRNTHDDQRTFQVTCEAVYGPERNVEKKLGPVEVTVPPGETQTVTLNAPWENPKLWWPEPDPHLYTLRTTVLQDGQPVDVMEERFGYRWVSQKDGGIYINGVRRNFWNWVGVQGRPWTGKEWLERFRSENNRFTRFSHNRKTRNFLKTREQRLDFYDEHGVAGRLCSMIDGMRINRHLGDKVRSPVTGELTVVPNREVWEGFERHIRQLARAYRNHPSVIFYQVENELVYINGMNLGYPLDDLEDLMGDVIEAGRAEDPTRPYSVGGAGDLDCEAEINCPHYPLGSYDWYPENAYTVEKIKSKLDMYPAWENNKPWVVGESVYAHNLEFGSYALGDAAFRSETYAQRGKARFLRMLYGGYRWAGVSGFFPWCNLDAYEDARKVFSPLYVVPRKQTHRLYAGKRNDIPVKVMNDTLHSDRVTFEWSYRVGDEQVAGNKDTFRVRRGFGRERTLTIRAPETESRLEGELTLKLSQPDSDEAEPYTDVRSVPVLPAVDSIEAEADVLVLDRSDRVNAFLEETGLQFEQVDELSEAKGKSGLLVVGPDSLTADEAFGRDVLQFAGRGGRVVVLEQERPLGGTNLPAPLNATAHYGGYAHPQALGTPVFRDLGEDDLIDWAGDHPTYENVYEKPTEGGRSLAECGKLLPYSALVEMPAGDGVIVLSQLRVGAKLGIDPAADVLLRNLIEHYGGYRPATGVTAVYAPQEPMLRDKVQATGALTELVDSVEAALDPEAYQVAVVHASEENLAALNRLKDRAEAFQQAGGWILLNGLTPAGIEQYNRFLGTDHLVRPFRMERVVLENSDHRLAATLGNRDVAMYSPKHLQHDKNWISWNVFTYVVDAARNVAPFTLPPGAPDDPMEFSLPFEHGHPDHDPHNFVNGMVQSDNWRYIRQIWIDEGAERKPLVFRFRKPYTISKVRVWNNDAYWTIQDMDIVADGNAEQAVRTTLPDANQMVEVQLPEPRQVDQSVNLEIESWRQRRPDRPDTRLVGVNNVEFLRAETPEGVVPIDSAGGLVAYPRGEGGTFLCQLKFLEDEPNPENALKKARILGGLLQNMGAGSKSSTIAMPGVNLRYSPVSLLDHCTQYLAQTEGRSSWFGHGARDMSNLQVGEQRFGGVLYKPVSYHTAPVPDCIVLARRGNAKEMPEKVEGIDVGAKADVLFFLHAADVRIPVRPRERERLGRGFELPELMRYTIRYSDGKTHQVPVVLEKDVDHWLQEKPRPVPDATVATTVPVPETEQKGVLYGMQVDNPRPGVEIESIDVELGRRNNNYQGRAQMAVVAITLGEVME